MSNFSRGCIIIILLLILAMIEIDQNSGNHYTHPVNSFVDTSIGNLYRNGWIEGFNECRKQDYDNMKITEETKQISVTIPLNYDDINKILTADSVKYLTSILK